jgi:hypothetical protein
MRGRIAGLLTAIVMFAPVKARAEWQFKPFLGLTFGPSTTYIDLDHAAGSVVDEQSGIDSTSSHPVIGIGVLLLGEVFGIEGEFSRSPGFFQVPEVGLIQSSAVQTLTGNVVVAVPARLSRYTLRPYAVAGFGMMSVRIADRPPVNRVDVADRISAIDFGGGAAGFFNDRVGVSWDLRHYRSIAAKEGDILFEDGQLSFWRANMALVLRY